MGVGFRDLNREPKLETLSVDKVEENLRARICFEKREEEEELRLGLGFMDLRGVWKLRAISIARSLSTNEYGNEGVWLSISPPLHATLTSTSFLALAHMRISSNGEEDRDDGDQVRDIHALTSPHPPVANRGRRGEVWDTSSHRPSSLSMSIGGSSNDNFTTMSGEFSALAIAGSTVGNGDNGNMGDELARVGEEEIPEETNPLAIVPNSNPLDLDPINSNGQTLVGDMSMQRVKIAEIESKISAWQTAKIAKLDNRFKREDSIIGGWEGEQIQKATTWMKKVERKLEDKRARALEKMQNEVAEAHRKAEERRASAEAKRGTKVTRVLEIANLMRALGRAPAKRSFF
ncbi:hypothetical protein HHK36_011916 [Tetracentron sinense]|uniref:Remorin C-terminal domain-containing protein n=1 Tax=Tetracentron sinense TaxID=13715 RepID=A0A834ZDR8_TETSI|nr:hypothetical protein HHK36_011916 [Tetracentron sinense]